MHGLDSRRFASGDHLGLDAAAVLTAVAIGGFPFLTSAGSAKWTFRDT